MTDDLSVILELKEAQESMDKAIALIVETTPFMPDKSLVSPLMAEALVFAFWKELGKTFPINDKMTLFDWLRKDKWQFLARLVPFLFETGRAKVQADKNKQINSFIEEDDNV